MAIGTITRRVLGYLAALSAIGLLLVTAARADVTITVSTTTDEATTGNGTCSLREAVLYANGTAETDCAAGTASGTTTITLPAGHYTITSPLPITGAAVVNGSGAPNTQIDAGNASQVINVGAAAQVQLNGVTVTGGTSGLTPCTSMFCLLIARAGAPGGGILNAGSLTLNGSVVSNNVASAGSSAAVFCAVGSACPGRSPAAGGAGGGIYNTGTLTITGSTISGNKTNGAGGGDASAATTNPGAGANGGNGGASGAGGGVDNAGGTVTITNSTISGNSTGPGGDGGAGSAATAGGDAGGNGGTPAAAGAGGAIENTGSLTIGGSTISGNSTGAGGNGAAGGAGSGAANGTSSSGAAGGSGGGVDSSTVVNVQNSTITGNATGAGGAAAPGTSAGVPGTGGALNQTAAGATLAQATVASNTSAGAGGGLNQAGAGTIAFSNSIIAANHTGSATSNCGGTMITSSGNNVVFGDNSCGIPQGGDPKLQPLADNGGPTQTMALAPGSSAVDVVATNDCLPADQRGVARPQGAKCDAGAYELAPPSVSAVTGSAKSTTSATVTASVNPNRKDTTVMVRYGTTTAYGSTTPPEDLGAAGTAASFSAVLTGLVPNTTYHAQVVATNGDGTTASGDVSFNTLTPVSATLASASVGSNKLSVTVVCDHGNPTDSCSGPITVSAHVTTAKGKPVAVTNARVAAKKTKKKPKPVKTKTTVVQIASSKYSVATGHRATIKLSLNARGRSLLNTLYKVPATVTLGGTTTATRKVTFGYGRVRSPLSFTWKFNRRFTFAQLLTVGPLPAKSKVLVSCHGGGCPFAKRTFSFKAKNARLNLAAKLKQAHLKPKATLQIQITAANAVGKVVRFTMVSNDQPVVVSSCLVPGARKPSACTSR